MPLERPRAVTAAPIGSTRWTARGRRSYRVGVPETRRYVAVPAAAALLLLAACSAPADDVGGLPTRPSGQPASASPSRAGGQTPTAAGPTATEAVDRTDVLAVYTAWWKALQSAYARGDPADPGLAAYAVDPILSRQRATIRALRAQGVVQRTTFTLQPQLRYQTDEYAEVEDCVRGPANTYYDAGTGQPRAPRGYRNDVPTEDRLLMTLRRRGDRWYVVAATGKGDVRC